MCFCVCLGLHKAYAHGDCCKAMHACVRVFVVIAAGRWTHVSECVFGLAQGVCSR